MHRRLSVDPVCVRHLRGLLDWVLCLGVLLLSPLVARAGDSPLDEALRRAVDAAEALEASAWPAYLGGLEEEDISPWLVADELVARGKALVARMLASQVPGEEGKRLRELLDRRGEERDGEIRGRLTNVAERLSKRQYPLARSLAKAIAPPAGSILAVRALDAAADVERGAKAAEAEVTLRERAAGEAERLGWLSGAEDRFALAASVCHGRHRSKRAIGLWTEALRVAASRGNVARIGHLFHGRAAALADGGQLLEAAAEYERAIQHGRAEESVENMLAAQIALAGVHVELGHYARAFTMLERALAEARSGDSAGSGADVEALRVNVADALMWLTNLDIYLGRWDAGREHASAALAGARGLAPPPDELIGACLGNMSLIEAHDDDAAALERATGYFDEAVSRFQALDDMRSVAQALENWAVMLARRGMVDSALHNAEGAEVSLGDASNPLELASVRITLGDLLRRSGRTSEALAKHGSALEVLRVAEARAELARCLTSLAQDHLASKAPAAALAEAKEAFQVLGGVVGGLGDSESVAAKDELYPLFEVGAAAALAIGDRPALSWFLEGGRAGSLLEALGSRQSLESAVLSPELLKRKSQAAETARHTLRTLAEAASATTPSLPAIRAARDARTAALRELSAVADAIQRERGASVALPKPLDLAGIASRLGATEALVLYSVLEGRGLAFVVRRTGPPSVVDLREERPIAEAVEALRAALPVKSSDWVDALAKVRTLLVDPLKLPPDATRILVSPDGSLGYLPFALLFADPKLLAEGKPGALTRDVAFVPSGTVLAFLRDEAKEQRAAQPVAASTPPGEVLALGDPVYETADANDTSPLARLRGAFSLERLEASAGEVAAVGTKGRVFVREKASEATLRAELSKLKVRLRALHLACHGLVDLDQPLASGLALTVDAQDDGLLTTMEILGLRIPADLVVLSACQSGLGWTSRGEGIVGFTRAFLHAGAPRVVASLWKVNDQATAELMKRMYAAWKPGTSVAVALRTAQESIRTDKSHDWSHPRYWAPWVLWGLPE